MSSIGAALLNSLRSVERPGDFCVGGTREIFMPTVDVDGVGRIAFPLLPVQAERLVAIAQAAPYGRGAQTVVDREVRRTWQIDSGKVRIGGRCWEKTLAELVTEAALGLGVDAPVVADFYKLLVYDVGSYFVHHRDTEKVPGMFATMVLALPSTHSGGELVIKHLGREEMLDLYPEEPSQIGFAAFYADCVHEVRPVPAGHRVTLVYNLRFLGEQLVLKAPDYRAEQKRIVELLRSWAGAEGEPDKLVLPLEHAYTPAERRNYLSTPSRAPMRGWRLCWSRLPQRRIAMCTLLSCRSRRAALPNILAHMGSLKSRTVDGASLKSRTVDGAGISSSGAQPGIPV